MDWYYSLPSGRIDVAGESPRQTAVRELLEETGLKAKKMVAWGKVQKTGKVIHFVYFFIAKDCVEVAKQKLDSGERIEVMTMTFEQFLKLSDTPKFYESELVITMLRARLNPKLKASFKKAIFN
jgi:ADP-ribose pyrophosphatase